MVTSVNSTLLNYLSAQGLDSAAANALTAQAPSSAGTTATTLPPQALQRAAGMAKAAGAVQSLDTAQKALAKDLRAAMSKAGIKLTGPIEFSVKADGSADINGSDADVAATKAFLKADTSQPSFATRIATQARDALKLSTSIQRSAAISQAAKFSKTTGGVISLYTSLMQQASATSVVFSVSAAGSSLSYPGSLSTNA